MNSAQTEPAAEAVTPPPAPAEAGADALPSPGTLLRRARERAGLGADDLAGQLKLAKGTLEALERDDFAALSEPVYVRGYYRKIAKVLPIAEAELINAYNARVKPPQSALPLRRLPLAGGVAAGASRHAQGPGVGLLVGALILVGLAVAVLTREPPRRLVDTVATDAPAAPAPQPVAPAPVPPSDTGATTASTNAAATNGEAVQPPAAAPATGVPATTTTAPAAPAATHSAIPAVPNQLVLDFTEASYVRVEDNQGKTLKIGLVRGGERHALDGAPPYTVFLGNAQNVKVFLGGQPVDFSAHVDAQNDTARFTVP